MPNCDPAINKLRAIVGNDVVLCDRNELLVYECDGFPIAKGLPDAVVFPADTQQVAQCVRVLAEHDLQIIPRGSGTGLAGGCVAFNGGVIVSTSRMTCIEQIDLKNRVAVVQAGVRNLALSEAVAALGTPLGSTGDDQNGSLRFSPDPSSQAAATIGGNAATNAGGINTLKYGVTTHHILGMELVLPDGTITTTRTGGLCDGIGADLPALLCGSEGTLGIVTRLWCRLAPTPRHFRTVYAVFDSTHQACETVSDVIALGIVPTSMEMLDGAMIRVVEEAFGYGFPQDAQAMLLIEIDGIDRILDHQLKQIVEVCTANHAQETRQCADAQQRAELWRVRKRAFGAIGRISRSYCTQDACIPRSMLAQAIEQITAIGQRFDLKVSNVFHAGDGNVHPILLFDEDDPQQVQRVLGASEAILEYCIGIGGTITGEHGVGVEKLHLMPKMFNADTLKTFGQIKTTFDPDRRINDGKLVPSDRLRIELKQPLSPNTPGGAL